MLPVRGDKCYIPPASRLCCYDCSMKVVFYCGVVFRCSLSPYSRCSAASLTTLVANVDFPEPGPPAMKTLPILVAPRLCAACSCWPVKTPLSITSCMPGKHFDGLGFNRMILVAAHRRFRLQISSYESVKETRMATKEAV